METNPIVSLLSNFSIPEVEYTYEPSASGFIHDSGVISTAARPQYLLQKFNNTIFAEPDAVYLNFQQVSSHLTDTAYKHFNWILTKDHKPFHKDENGQFWRLLSYVPDSVELKQIQSIQEAFECGKILGLFHRQVAGGDATSLEVTLPKFHDTATRWKDFENALGSGLPERIEGIRAEIRPLERLKEYALDAPVGLPLRMCHNDSKLSNILFQKYTHESLCFVDLDTLMPGYLFHDFGDLVRGVITLYSEDTHQVRKQEINKVYFNALLKGMRSSELQIHTKEIASLVYGLICMPFLHGIRALTDYLLGDQYYKVSHPEQNRCRGLNLLGFARECFLKKEDLDQQIRSVLETTI